MSFHLTTADLQQQHRTQFWHDSVSAHLIPAEADYRDPNTFEGSLSGHSLGKLTICEMKARAHTFVRTPKMLRRAPDEDFVAVFVRSGSMLFSQGGREVKTKAGSIILLDAGRQFTHAMEQIDALVVRLPRRHFLTSYPRAEFLTCIDLANKSALALIAHEMVKEALQLNTHANTSLASTRFASALLDTLTVVMEHQVADQVLPESGKYDCVFRKATRFIEANLEDYDLSVEDVAASINTSARTLARAFAAHGTTTMKFLWKARLDASYALLSNGRVNQVTQAAYQCGFNDLSHFTRTFKQSFGMSPSSYIRSAAPLQSTEDGTGFDPAALP